MKKPSSTNWDNVKASGENEKLPAGGYVLEVKKAEIKTSAKGYEYLDLSIEIAEGEYKDFYTNQYKNSTIEPKKYKGHFRTGVPKDDGSEKDGYTQSNLKAMTNAFEDSNSGYHWDWDESKLVGLIVGGLFRNSEWEYDGNTGFYTECSRLVDVNKIREGNFKIPKDKLLKKTNTSSAPPAGFEEVNDDDIPF